MRTHTLPRTKGRRTVLVNAVFLLAPLLFLGCVKKKAQSENHSVGKKNDQFGINITGSESGAAWELQSVEVVSCQERADAWCDTDAAFSQDELKEFAGDYGVARSGWRTSRSDVVREIESLAHLKKSGLERDMLVEVLKADKVTSRKVIEKVFPARAKSLWDPLVKKNECQGVPTNSTLGDAERNTKLSLEQLYQSVSPEAPKLGLKQITSLYKYMMSSTMLNSALRKNPASIPYDAKQIRYAIDAFAKDKKPEMFMIRVLDRDSFQAGDCGQWTGNGFNGFSRDSALIGEIAEIYVTGEPIYLFLLAGPEAPYVHLALAGRHAAQSTSNSQTLADSPEDELLFDHETRFLNHKTLWFKGFTIALMADQGKSRQALPLDGSEK